MIGWVCIPMGSVTAIVARVTSASKGQDSTHLAFLIGCMDHSQRVLPIYGRDNIWHASVLKGQGIRRVRQKQRGGMTKREAT